MFLREFKATGISTIAFAVILTVIAAGNGFSQDALTKIEPPPAPAQSAVSVGLVIDNSGSLRLLLDGIISFVNDAIEENGPEDEAFLVRFVSSDRVVLLQDFTSVKSQLHDAVDEMYIEGGQTALIDAINFSARHLSENSRPEPNRAKALVVVTDGDERNSISKLDETIGLLKKSNIRVFVIAVAEGKVETKLLDRFAKETGGRVFLMTNRSQLRTAAKELGTVLRKP